ncbi:MAG: hypothetical protein IKG93_10010 [Clostridiales bacterium]|nr:hypothetical protein [Clostridiales bacterium]
MDCLKEYKKRANERKRFARDELLLFKNAIEVWEAEKENVDKLILEKRRFRKALERYADEMHGEVLFNLDYSYYRIDSFIDAALILPNAVLLLNLRVPNHDSAVDQDGNLCWFDPYSSKLVKENIRIELFKQELMVRMMLSSAGLESFRVLTSLIVGGDEYLFVNHNTDDVNSGRLGSLEKSLTLEHSTCFTKDEQSIVTKKLWEEKSNFDGSDLSYESDLLDAFRKLQAKV